MLGYDWDMSCVVAFEGLADDEGSPLGFYAGGI